MSPPTRSSPLHPREISVPSSEEMTETQRLPLLPVPFFLGQPEHRRHDSLDVRPRLLQIPLSDPPYGYSRSYRDYTTLPPPRTRPVPPYERVIYGSQAVPIAALLADTANSVTTLSPIDSFQRQQSRQATTSPLSLSIPAATHPAQSTPRSASSYAASPRIAQPQQLLHVYNVPTTRSPEAEVNPQHQVAPLSAPPRSSRSLQKAPMSSPWQRVTAPASSSSSPVRKLENILSIRQQPIAARACGFGERDRRVVDPPPILELSLRTPESGLLETEPSPSVSTTLHCPLITADTFEDASTIDQFRPDMPATQRLMGTAVASPFTGKDEHGQRGTFFVFPDLSCRSPGSYRFRFRLLIVDPLNLVVGATSPIQSFINSAPFTVYTAKEFPGMRPSSSLLKALRRQGLNVAVKKGSEATKKGARRARVSEDEESSGDEDTPRDEVEDVTQSPVASSSKEKKRRRKR